MNIQTLPFLELLYKKMNNTKNVFSFSCGESEVLKNGYHCVSFALSDGNDIADLLRAENIENIPISSNRKQIITHPFIVNEIEVIDVKANTIVVYYFKDLTGVKCVVNLFAEHYDIDGINGNEIVLYWDMVNNASGIPNNDSYVGLSEMIL